MASDFKEIQVVGAAAPTILVTASGRKQRIIVTCGFGAATVRLSTVFKQGNDPRTWFRLPAATHFPWELDEGEGLYAYSDVATTVSVAVKDVP